MLTISIGVVRVSEARFKVNQQTNCWMLTYFWHYSSPIKALHELYRQFQLGDDSPHAPYVNYLKNQPRGLIPSEWSEVGTKLLREILDLEGEDEQAGLPPEEYKKDYKDTWIGECGGEDTDLAKAAYYQFTSRDEDTLMGKPFYCPLLSYL